MDSLRSSRPALAALLLAAGLALCASRPADAAVEIHDGIYKGRTAKPPKSRISTSVVTIDGRQAVMGFGARVRVRCTGGLKYVHDAGTGTPLGIDRRGRFGYRLGAGGEVESMRARFKEGGRITGTYRVRAGRRGAQTVCRGKTRFALRLVPAKDRSGSYAGLTREQQPIGFEVTHDPAAPPTEASAIRELRFSATLECENEDTGETREMIGHVRGLYGQVAPDGSFGISWDVRSNGPAGHLLGDIRVEGAFGRDTATGTVYVSYAPFDSAGNLDPNGELSCITPRRQRFTARRG